MTAEQLCAGDKPAWPEISISKNDVLTEGTATSIERSNIGRETVCGRAKPA